MSSTRPRMSSTARGIATRDAMPSAYVAARSRVDRAAGAPGQGHRRGGLGLDADDPAVAGAACRSHDPTPLISAPLPTGTRGDDRHRQGAGRRRRR